MFNVIHHSKSFSNVSFKNSRQASIISQGNSSYRLQFNVKLRICQDNMKHPQIVIPPTSLPIYSNRGTIVYIILSKRYEGKSKNKFMKKILQCKMCAK